MTGIQIKIAGEWIELPEDFSISLEQSSPLFNDEGVFSFPFEVLLEPNRKIFRNVDDPFGDITLADIDKAEAELWFNGVMFDRGIIEINEEVEFEDSIPVTFLSGNSDFMSRIENMNARDVPLDREIKLGYVITKATYYDEGEEHEIPLPDYVMMNYTEFNVTEQYPVNIFCNVRVCASDENGYYKILNARRPYSGVCYYVIYFLDCLFKSLDISVRVNDLLNVEDMSRLAFFTTQCHATLGKEEREVSLSEIRNKDFCGDIFSLTVKHTSKLYGTETTISTEDFKYIGSDVYATNENFPDQLVTDIIKDLSTAFGIRFVYDTTNNRMDIVYIKDILKSDEIKDLKVGILSQTLTKDKAGGIRLTYGNEDDTQFNYTDFSNVEEFNTYNEILEKGFNQYDKVCKIDRTTGNAYRVKVDKETGGNPSLFEVGGYRDYVESVASEEEDEMSVSFSPVIVNSVSVQKNDDGSTTVLGSGNGHRRSLSRSILRRGEDVERGSEVLAIFADVKLVADTVYDKDFWGPGMTQNEASEQKRGQAPIAHLKALCQELYDEESSDEPPLRSYDAGYTLGIMRGPGNDSGVEITASNYDGEGNDSWVQTVGSYAFTSDSCDMYGSFFDYNGTEEGGADQSGRFSLKLVAEKDGYPIGDNYKGRGLVAKFLSEYLYFMAHKKTVTLTVKMSITQIIGIDFLKRYKVGDYVGFINKVSYTLTNYGVENVAVEMYVL